MREIKFRAWDNTLNKMRQPPSEFSSNPGPCITLDGRMYVNGKHQDITLMQYTGLKDKNGVEIYEGDVVIMGVYSGTAVIKHETGMYMARFEKANLYCGVGAHHEKLKVIGNIYQNGDLLD